MLRTTKTMLVLLLIVTLALIISGCEDTGEITVTVEGKIEDWNVTGVDTAVEAELEKVLDFGDNVVEAARDTLEDVVEWGIEQNGDADDLSDIQGVW